MGRSPNKFQSTFGLAAAARGHRPRRHPGRRTPIGAVRAVQVAALPPRPAPARGPAAGGALGGEVGGSIEKGGTARGRLAVRLRAPRCHRGQRRGRGHAGGWRCSPPRCASLFGGWRSTAAARLGALDLPAMLWASRPGVSSNWAGSGLAHSYQALPVIGRGFQVGGELLRRLGVQLPAGVQLLRLQRLGVIGRGGILGGGLL